MRSVDTYQQTATSPPAVLKFITFNQTNETASNPIVKLYLLKAIQSLTSFQITETMRVFKRRNFVILVDVIMFAAILLLLSPRLTGLPLHEILGTVIIIPVIIHLLNSWQWIHSTSKKIFTTSKLRTRINYLLNTILFILIIIVIVSGLFISEIVVPATGINLIKDRAWGTIHTQTTTFVMLFSGLHIAINLDWIVALFKKRLRTSSKTVSAKPNDVLQIIKRICILIFAVLIVSFSLIVIIGMPKIERIYKHSFIKEYTPTLKNGVGQFLGETLFVVVIAFIGRKWLRIKL